MIQYFRALLVALQALHIAITRLANLSAEEIELRRLEGDSEARLRTLELRREEWEAKCEALILKAEGQYRAASAAEARAKTHAKASEVFDEDDEDSDEEVFAAYLEELSRVDESGSAREGMQTMRDHMVSPPPSPRQVREAARARKREARA